VIPEGWAQRNLVHPARSQVPEVAISPPSGRLLIPPIFSHLGHASIRRNKVVYDDIHSFSRVRFGVLYMAGTYLQVRFLTQGGPHGS